MPPSYTIAIGEALLIVADEAADVNSGMVKPVLALQIAAGRVEIGWS